MHIFWDVYMLLPTEGPGQAGEAPAGGLKMSRRRRTRPPAEGRGKGDGGGAARGPWCGLV